MSACPDISSLTLSQLQDLQNETQQLIAKRKQLQLKEKFIEDIEQHGYYVDFYEELINIDFAKFYNGKLMSYELPLYYNAYTYSPNIYFDDCDIIINNLKNHDTHDLAKYLQVKFPNLSGRRLCEITNFPCEIGDFGPLEPKSSAKGTILIRACVYFKQQQFPPNNNVTIIFKEQKEILTNFTIKNGKIIGDNGINYGDKVLWDSYTKYHYVTWIPNST